MHTHALVQQLMARGHEVTLFALPDSDPNFRTIAPPLQATDQLDDAKRFREEPVFGRDFINKFYAYSAVLRKIGQEPFDLVHNNSLHYLPLALGHTLHCPMVTTLHCPPFESLRAGVILASPYAGNHFVAVSQSLGREWAPDLQQYSVIPNGIAVDGWAFSPAATERTAFWFGRICPEKGPEYAIRAARLAGFRLRLAGSIYDQDYFDRTIAPELGGDVEYIGHLNHAEVCREAGRAAVGLFTSVWEEPFGLVLPELLACGTPVAAFDSGAAREILDERSGIIVPKCDVAALADALPKAAALNRAHCRQRVDHHFTFDQMIDRYEALYHQLVPGLYSTTAHRSPSVSVA